MLKLANANPVMGDAPSSHIKTILDERYGPKEWLYWDIETFSLDLGVILSDLTRDKIQMLQVLVRKPHLVFEDSSFFMHVVQVMNNEPADFDSLPFPNTLELAFALKELSRIIHGYVPPDETTVIYNVCLYMMMEEGYSEPVPLFEFVPKEALMAGQESEDTRNKQLAISQYIKHMESL